MRFLLLSVCFFPLFAMAQLDLQLRKDPLPSPKWYESFSIRGYSQIRYNRLFETNPNLNCEQCDRSWGNNG